MKYSASKHRGISNRIFYFRGLSRYYKTTQWIERRKSYLESVNGLSEISGQVADQVHHIIYPFKKISDFDNVELYGNEKDYQLLAVTKEEHKIIHDELQQFAHRKKSVILSKFN